MKTALITGITSQDSSYLAEFSLEKGYEVHSITRRFSISKLSGKMIDGTTRRQQQTLPTLFSAFSK